MAQQQTAAAAQPAAEKKQGKLLLFFKELWRRIQEDNVAEVGAQLAYYLIMSFFPFILFLLNLLTFTSLGQQQVVNQLLSILPREARTLIEPVILDLVQNRSGALLSISLLFALWSGSSGMVNLIRAMESAFDIDNRRRPLLKQMLSLLYTLVLALIIILALGVQVFGNALVASIFGPNPGPFVSMVNTVTQIAFPVVVMTLGFALIYRFGPGFPEKQAIYFSEALLGGAVASIGWTLSSKLFSVYVDNFGNYSKTYGSLGGIIILLFWLFISSLIIMLGAEVVSAYVTVYKRGLRFRAGLPSKEEEELQRHEEALRTAAERRARKTAAALPGALFFLGAAGVAALSVAGAKLHDRFFSPR